MAASSERTYGTVFDGNDTLLDVVSKDAAAQVSYLDDIDRVSRIAELLAGVDQGEGERDRFDQQTAIDVLSTLVEVRWRRAPEEDRALLIDFLARPLGSLGVRLIPEESNP